MNWKVVATAPDQMTAEMWVDLLRARSFLCKVHPGDVSGFLGVSPYSVRVMVPESELDEARDYLDDITGDEFEEEP